jgi:hypothetical protein
VGSGTARPSTVIVNCEYCQHDMARSIPHQPMDMPARPDRQSKPRAIASFRADMDRSSPPKSWHRSSLVIRDGLSQHSTFRTQVRILGMVSNPVPDARRAGPGIGWKERRAAPRHAAVWVRVGGRWRRGRIIEWVRQIDRDGWECVILADEPVSGPPWQGRYAFDPRSVRARYTDQPPADLARSSL